MKNHFFIVQLKPYYDTDNGNDEKQEFYCKKKKHADKVIDNLLRINSARNVIDLTVDLSVIDKEVSNIKTHIRFITECKVFDYQQENRKICCDIFVRKVFFEDYKK